MPLFPEGDNNPIDVYPIIPSLDGTELLAVANKGTTLLYLSTGQIADFVTSAEHDVTAAAVIADNGVVRGDGGARGVQSSGVTIDDSGNMAFPANASISWNSADVSITHSANLLSFSGAANGYSFDQNIKIAATKGIDFGAGDITIIQTTNTLTFAGALTGYIFDAPVSGITTLSQTSYHDLTEIATPANPSADVARLYSVDDGFGITRLRMRDSSGNVSSVGGREILFANRTYFVRTDGSDSNTGIANTAGGAFLTIDKGRQAAYALDLNGFTVTVQIGDGTYTAGVTCTGMPPGWNSTSPITFQGNTGTPANVIVSTTSATCFTAQDGASILVTGVELRTTTAGDCLLATRGSKIIHGNVRFGTCAGFHKETNDHGRIYNSGNYTISGNAVAHQHINNMSYQLISSATVTISGTPAFSSYFVGVNGAYTQYVAVTFSGSATGPRYLIHDNGSVFTDVAFSLTYFPGDSAGTQLGGGVFNDFNNNLFLLAGAAIDFGSGDVVISHAANQLFFAGAASGYAFDQKVQVSAGGLLSSGAAAGVGYTTGAGGTVTQGAGSGKATAVTLNKMCGDITMNNASLNAATVVSFTLTNSSILAADNLVLNHSAGGVTPGGYHLNARVTGDGTCVIDVRNQTAGALAEAIVIRFTVLRGATA